MVRLKGNLIYTKPRIYCAIEEVKKLCKETNCIRNKHLLIYREFENENVDIDDVIINFDGINKKNLQKNDNDVTSQRMDLYLKKRLNKKLNNIYGEEEASLSVKGDDDESGYQPASNISIEWIYNVENIRYWNLELYTRPLDVRLFYELDYTVIDKEGGSIFSKEEPPENFKDFCKNLSLILEKHKLRKS
jgi:hypothetical protein